MDTAKASWVLYERRDLGAGDLTKSILSKVKLNLRQKARFVAVPTTSGTGADVTWVAVLTDRAMNRKIVFAHSDIVPNPSVPYTNLTLVLPICRRNGRFPKTEALLPDKRSINSDY